MREHKYRVWDEEAEQYYYSDKESDDYIWCFEEGKIKVYTPVLEPATIDEPEYVHGEQVEGEIEDFTGRHDKNGKKEVYEGDEIYFSLSQTQHYRGYVKWSEKGLCYLVHCHWEKQDKIPNICNGYENNYEFEDICVKRLDYECSDIEIIGTIHDKEQQSS